MTDQPAELKLSYTAELHLGFQETLDLVAGVLCATGGFDSNKRDLVRAMKERLLAVGRLNVAAWRSGVKAARQEQLEYGAYFLCVKHFGDVFFPDMDPPVSYTARMAAWKATLDEEQRRRYGKGKLRLFGEAGRKPLPPVAQ